VADLAQAGHYQVACTRHLELRLLHRRQNNQPQPDADIRLSAVTSPNQYFDLCLGCTKPAPPAAGADTASTAAILSGAPKAAAAIH
ncbi:hypothetical protein GGH91_002745, partial [Coemansia sp. RSA 2671]